MTTAEFLASIQLYALHAGAQHSAISLSKQQQQKVDIRDAKIEKSKSGISQSLTVELFVDGRYSKHTTNLLQPSALKPFIEQAVQATRFLQPDAFRALPDPSLYPTRAQELHLFDPEFHTWTPHKLIQQAQSIFDTKRLLHPKLISAQSSFSTARYEHFRLHSNGFYGESASTYFSQILNLTLQAEGDKRAEDYAHTAHSWFNRLSTAEELCGEALLRSEEKIGEQKSSSGAYQLIVENRVASKFINILLAAMTAAAQAQGKTFLEGRLNTTITAPHLTIIDNPNLPSMLGSFWFDEEGIAPALRPLVQNGVYRNQLVDNYYGPKLGLTVNGASTGNLLFQGNTTPVEQILAQSTKSIWVKAFNGGNANPTTGDFSFGIAGLLYENGRPTMPITEMVASGNMLDLMLNLSSLGNDPYQWAAMQRPTLVFDHVYCSGN